MSAPFKLSASQLRRLATAIGELNDLTRRHGVRVDGYSTCELLIDDTGIEIKWDADDEQYVTDDRIGR